MKLANVKVVVDVEGEMLRKGRTADFGTDLSTSCDVLIPPTLLTASLVSTAVHTEFNPEEYGLCISSRSGIFRQPLILANGIGIIEGEYRGQLGLMYHNVYSGPTDLVEWALALREDAEGNKTFEQVSLADISAGARGKALKQYTKDTKALGLPIPPSMFVSHAPRGTIFVEKGTRLAQAFLLPNIPEEFERVSELSDTERGTNGFGSSGIK